MTSHESLNDLLRSAQSGDAEAQAMLGLRYALGRDAPRDAALAAEWIGKAAEQRVASAQYTFGLFHSTGQGVPQNSELAVAWYRCAAEQGHAKAQYNLGIAYLNGRGVPRDADLGMEWIAKAVRQNDPAVRQCFEKLKDCLPPVFEGDRSSHALTGNVP